MLKITTSLIVAAARKRGWTAEPLDEALSSVVALKPGNGRTYYITSCLTNTSAAPGYVIAEDKIATYQIAKRLQVPTAPFVVYDKRHPEVARQFLAEQRAANHQLVVKPADQNHGDGISLGIHEQTELTAAIRHAVRFSERIIVQRQVQGTDCRLLVVGDQVVAAAYRMPAFVEGDGRQTVEQLIARKNADPRRGPGHYSPLSRIPIADVKRYIGAERLKTVPHKDERVTVIGTANLSKGGEAVDITDDVHQTYKDAAIKLATTLEVGVCGVDFLCVDYRQPLSADNAALLEINNVPGLRMHHFPSVGTPRNVAGAVLDYFARRNGIDS